MIINYMELLVDEIFQEVKSMYGKCLTEKCIHDIKAMSLNNLPTMYFDYHIDEGEKKAFLLDRQRRITVLAKIAEAADIICLVCNENTDNKL